MTAAAGHSTDTSTCRPRLGRRGRAIPGTRRLGIVIAVALVGMWLSAGVAVAAPRPSGASSVRAKAHVDNAAGVDMSLVSSPTTSVGMQVYAVTDVSGGNDPTGTFTFSLFGASDPSCAALPVFVSTVPAGATAVDSQPYTTTAAGTYHWEVSYNGDINNAPAGPTSCANASGALIVDPYYSAMAVTAQAASGGTIQASAMLSGYSPTGTITFSVFSPSDMFCSSPVFTSTVAVSGSGTYASTPYVYPAGGQYKWQGSYSGDANNLSVGSTPCLNSPSEVTAPAPPASGLLYPTNGQTNVSSSVPFTWQPVAGVQVYFMTVGTSLGAWDLVWTGYLPPSQTSFQVPGLPAGNLSVVLYAMVNNAWTYQFVNFTAQPTEAAMTSPTNGSVGVNPDGTFTWSTVNGVPGVQGYALWISTVYGGANLVGTGLLPATQSSYTPPPLPAGKTLYVILFTQRNGVLSYQAITIATAAAGSNARAHAAVQQTPKISPVPPAAP